MNIEKMKSLVKWLAIGVLGVLAVSSVAFAFSGSAQNVAESGATINVYNQGQGIGSAEEEVLGASGSRFPNGISADSTSPSAGQVRGTTLTITGAVSTGAVTASGVQTLDAGQLRSYTNSTSTVATTQTLAQADILNYDTVLFTPNTASVTLTLPATSTLTSYIPTAGDRAEQCWQNATTTAGINVTFAAGAGMDLQMVATSTISGSAGVFPITPGNSACFKFIRQANTDVQVLMTSYIDGD